MSVSLAKSGKHTSPPDPPAARREPFPISAPTNRITRHDHNRNRQRLDRSAPRNPPAQSKLVAFLSAILGCHRGRASRRRVPFFRPLAYGQPAGSGGGASRVGCGQPSWLTPPTPPVSGAGENAKPAGCHLQTGPLAPPAASPTPAPVGRCAHAAGNDSRPKVERSRPIGCAAAGPGGNVTDPELPR